MTPQERQMVDDLFERLSGVEGAPRDPDATAAIAQGLRKAPNAVYALVQTVLVQDEALKRANSRIQQLEAGGASEPHQPGGFLDSMRETIFGQSQPRGSVPNVRPPEIGSRPVWNSGQAMQQAQSPGQYTLRSALWRAPGPSGRRRLIPGNRGGCGRRNDRRIAAAWQHPLHDGRQPLRLWRSGRVWRQRRRPESLERSIHQQSCARRRDRRHRLIRRSRRPHFACRIVRYRIERR
jgi:hypothetical protein